MFYSKKYPVIIITFLAALLVAVSGHDAGADVTFVSGDVSGEWTADSVIVVDSIRVPAGETLTIMPGVTILVTSYYKFEVLDNSVLHAAGTETDSIRLLPFTPGDRTLGIDFINASDQSILEYWYISDALTSGVHLNNSDITLRKCLIEESEAPTGVEGGGAVEILNGSDALIENNTFRNNVAKSHGGAIFVSSSNPVIKGNNIIDNSAILGSATGGGIHVGNSSSPHILNNLISNNTVTALGSFSVRHARGGGIFISGGSDIVISGNIIRNNFVNWEPQTTANGGGLYIINSDPYISNNVIADNEAESNNGGAFYLYNSDATIINNTIANNISGDLGGAIYAELSNPTIVNSILYFNQDSAGTEIFLEDFSNATVSYSDIEGSWPGTGNLDVDPLFRDMISGDYHLQAQMCGDQSDSPLIDVGSPEYADSLLDCFWGLGTELSDMGAYGGGAPGSPTGIGDDDEIVATPSEFFTVTNYPNPFNAQTTISYQLPEASHVTIEIYDDLGRKVTTLLNTVQLAGSHDVDWNATYFASGLYFYSIQVGNYEITRKMALLK
jgi:predicted outer membrane repeat protein